MKKVISCEYVGRELKKVVKHLHHGDSLSAINEIDRLLRACKHDTETLRDIDKGKVIKWK